MRFGPGKRAVARMVEGDLRQKRLCQAGHFPAQLKVPPPEPGEGLVRGVCY